MPPGRFSLRPSRRRHFFPLPALYLLILLLGIIAWTASHTTASWDYTTYNHHHPDPKRHQARDTYTPFPGRAPQHHYEKRDGMTGSMGFFEMLGRAQGGRVAVARPLGSVSSARRRHQTHDDRHQTLTAKSNNKHEHDNDRDGEGNKYDIVRLDDAISPPVGHSSDAADDIENGELKRGRMVIVENVD